MSRSRTALPLATWLLGLPGLCCLLLGLILLAGDFARLHPLLGGPAAGLALLVSAIALLGSAAFPFALRRLAEQDRPADDIRTPPAQ
ncbi:hypothetical protein E6C76_17690 [Pseudothauera nasutitermitis]|uniref:Uncharacterized protein n=1 Tax=Pseudothauera nasutitermitis TaxID=2565930 RepID=A0A4S4AT96_9RHOO|nr:hypothetical protein [Pseudothauera nasutitermitis]THF63084.1 hypothetical protein E6C76_17690 [Pseudothauera nasutitermitis]